MANSPTHFLFIKSREREVKDSHRVAAVWYNEEQDNFTVKLYRGVVLSWRDMADSILTIFPNNREEQE